METTVTTEDGRELRLDVGGDPDGPMILYHHGTPMSRLLYEPYVRHAKENGACLVGYDRPGYGGSTRQRGRAVANAVADARSIARALGKERIVTWGISGGGPHALACAALAPDLVAAAAALCCPAPYGALGLDFYDGMGELNVEDMQLALRDPAEFEKKSAADAEEMLAGSLEDHIKILESLLSDVDRAEMTGELANYFLEGAKIGLANGPGGYIDDGFAFVGPWGFDIAEIAVPVQLWQGREDRFVPFSHGAWLAEQIPGVDAHLSAEDGHLTLYGKVPAVQSWLLAHLT
jgi:pimeloyl-ACP methyl ester carboxylesterase